MCYKCVQMVIAPRLTLENEAIIACRAYYMLKGMQPRKTKELSTVNFNAEVYRKHMRRYMKVWKEAESELKTLIKARAVVLGELRALPGQYPGDALEQHRAAEKIEKAYYYRNLVAIHRCYFIQNLGGVLL